MNGGHCTKRGRGKAKRGSVKGWMLPWEKLRLPTHAEGRRLTELQVKNDVRSKTNPGFFWGRKKGGGGKTMKSCNGREEGIAIPPEIGANKEKKRECSQGLSGGIVLEVKSATKKWTKWVEMGFNLRTGPSIPGGLAPKKKDGPGPSQVKQN